jgi:hypothetical protein
MHIAITFYLWYISIIKGTQKHSSKEREDLTMTVVEIREAIANVGQICEAREALSTIIGADADLALEAEINSYGDSIADALIDLHNEYLENAIPNREERENFLMDNEESFDIYNEYDCIVENYHFVPDVLAKVLDSNFTSKDMMNIEDSATGYRLYI